eukprot:CAMPEP_0172325668 /NCGR_PEP_ID=MMETSP1058-20130122/54492_1 /TAXON_ID=83371 /ORGANISM="Detonula confervacea, Strain CCMP 353" /LENGTH=382 /DNA_ID=CAMNT_0013042259 /DNA_START=319 /DNA_END=1464 /DNA_ORIENTATION=+
MKEDRKIIILKIGGSSITNKAQEETLNEEALDWFAKLVASSVNPLFLSSDYRVDKDSNEINLKPQFIIVHGAGSFGHHSAKRYNLRCGKAAFLEESDYQNHPHNPTKRRKRDSLSCEAKAIAIELMQNMKRYQMQGLSKTRQSVQKLNAATVSCLIKHGVNAVGISPGMSFHRLRAHGATGLNGKAPNDCMGDDSPRGMQDLCESIKHTLQAGLVPVVHGDACMLYDGKRAGILGGDTIAEGLATLWNEGTSSEKRNSKISQVIFITDVAGVFSSDPKSNNNAQLIRSLKVNKVTGDVAIESKECDGHKKGLGEVDALNVSGSSHAHDVTGGLKAKLGAAVAIVQVGIDVIISQCGSDSTEQFVNGDFNSVWDVEAGTLLSQ